MAALGEAIGFKKIFSAGIVIFALASLACANSTSLPVLTIARIVQGIGGAALMSIAGAIVRYVMPAKYLGRGISGIAVTVAVSGAAGADDRRRHPCRHHLALAVPDQHSARHHLLCRRPRHPAGNTGERRRFDFGSAVLIALAIGPLVSGLSSIGTRDIAWWIPAGLLAVSAISGYLLVRRQEAEQAPMLPVDLLRIPTFRLSIIASITSFAAQMLAVVSLPFFSTTCWASARSKPGC